MFPNLNVETWIFAILIPWVILITGCDERAAQIALNAADRQAQQNTAMAELNKEVASGTHQLVEADAQARQEIVGVHRDLQAERSRLDTNWNALEQERKQIARERRTESLLVPVTTLIGGLTVVALLLGFCWYALVASRSSDDTEARLNELLVCELLPDEPMPLGGNERQPLLPSQSPMGDGPSD